MIRLFVGRACSLDNGRALALGTIGQYLPDLEPAAFVWDPATPGWSRTASIPASVAPSAGALIDLGEQGSACIGGKLPGLNRSMSIGATWHFSPATLAWREGPPLLATRDFFSGCMLSDGRVLVAGGCGPRPTGLLASCELYDPGAGCRVSAPAMPEPRQEHCAVRLNEGTVVVAGGIGPSAFKDESGSRATFRFDPLSSRWTTCGPLAEARKHHTLVALQDGRAATFGGWRGRAGQTASIEVFDPAARTWSNGGALLTKKMRAAAALLPDGRVLIAGGTADWDGGVAVFAETEIWDPLSGKTTAGPRMRTPRVGFDLLTLSSGELLAVGGSLEKGLPVERLANV